MLSQKTVLPHLALEGAFSDRLNECLMLALDAPRSAARSQGRRTLLTVLGQTLPVFVTRFPELMEQLEPHIRSRDPAVQEMWVKAFPSTTTHPDDKPSRKRRS